MMALSTPGIRANCEALVWLILPQRAKNMSPVSILLRQMPSYEIQLNAILINYCFLHFSPSIYGKQFMLISNNMHP